MDGPPVPTFVEHDTGPKKQIGDRMKEYEAPFGTIKIDPTLPYVVRCDGHHFSTFMRGFDKPHDIRIHRAMLLTAHDMVFHFSGCVCGFTCSDEITLIFPASKSTEPEPEEPEVERKKKKAPQNAENQGRLVKTVSLLAGYASSAFYRNLLNILHEDAEKNINLIRFVNKTVPHFDARAFNVPFDYEVINNVKWRHLFDYRRNSISGLAQKHFKSKELHGLHGEQMMEKLKSEKGIDWHDMPGWYKWGAFVKKQKYATTAWVGKSQGHEVPVEIPVIKHRTVTRVFEMSRKHSPEDDQFIFTPFITDEEFDVAKGFNLCERDEVFQQKKEIETPPEHAEQEPLTFTPAVADSQPTPAPPKEEAK